MQRTTYRRKVTNAKRPMMIKDDALVDLNIELLNVSSLVWIINEVP